MATSAEKRWPPMGRKPMPIDSAIPIDIARRGHTPMAALWGPRNGPECERCQRGAARRPAHENDRQLPRPLQTAHKMGERHS